MPENYEELARRCEEATGADRKLFCTIIEALAGAISYGRQAEFLRFVEAAAWLDAAMTLVPEGVGFNLDRYWIREGARWRATIATGGVPGNPRTVYEAWDAYSPALATAAASLRARAAQSNA